MEIRLTKRSATFVFTSRVPVELIFPTGVEAATCWPRLNGNDVIVPATGAFIGLER